MYKLCASGLFCESSNNCTTCNKYMASYCGWASRDSIQVSSSGVSSGEAYYVTGLTGVGNCAAGAPSGPVANLAQQTLLPAWTAWFPSPDLCPRISPYSFSRTLSYIINKLFILSIISIVLLEVQSAIVNTIIIY